MGSRYVLLSPEAGDGRVRSAWSFAEDSNYEEIETNIPEGILQQTKTASVGVVPVAQ